MAERYSERAATNLSPQDMSELTAVAEGLSTSVSHVLRIAAREHLAKQHLAVADPALNPEILGGDE